MPAARRAVVLLSGGLDSTTLLALATRQGYAIHALSFDYGQRHSAELSAARKSANRYGVEQHLIAKIDLRVFGGSALTSDIPVPKDRAIDDGDTGIPVTYVPFRNAHFLAAAVSWAEVLGAQTIFIGAVEPDSSGYPDCRPAYYEAFQQLVRTGTRDGSIEIATPLIHLRKKEIVALGLELGAPFHLTWSCYSSAEAACGECESCALRLRAFAEAGMADPIPYARPVP